jgi:hypothetical protein
MLHDDGRITETFLTVTSEEERNCCFDGPLIVELIHVHTHAMVQIMLFPIRIRNEGRNKIEDGSELGT